MKDKTILKRCLEYMIYASLVVMLIFIISRIYAMLLISPDDIGYKNIMSGVTTGEPSPYCWFIRYPLSYTISALYRLFPNIEWYDWFLIGCHMLCYFLIFCRAKNCKGNKKIFYIVISTIVILFLCIEYTINLEWSTTAGILGATAVFRYVTIATKTSKRTEILEYVICFVLFCLGFNLRYNVVALYIPLAFFCWLKRCYDINQWYGKTKEMKVKEALNVGFLLSVICLVGVVMGVHSKAYSTDEWESYSKYTKDRSILVDYYGYPDYDEYTELYESANISEEMLTLMKSDYNYVTAFDHVDNVDLSALADVMRANKENVGIGEIVNNIYKKIDYLITRDRFLIPLIVVLACFLILIFAMKDNNKISIMYGISIVGWFIITLAYTAHEGRLPIRIGICFVFGFVATVCAILYNQFIMKPDFFNKNTFGFVQKIGILFLTVGILFANLYDVYIINLEDEQSAAARNQILEYCANHQEGMFLRDNASYAQWGTFFGNDIEVSNYISTGGWTYNSEVYEEILENNNFNGIYNGLESGKQTYYLVSRSRCYSVRDRIVDYYQSIGKNVFLHAVDRFDTVDGEVIVFQFVDMDKINH